ncbi:MAG: RIP metalloprotease RseP [Candidatus Omnitrophota bacterium]
MIVFVLTLSVLILIHEFGHFLAARQLGIRVEKFALGFGPKILSKKVGDTEYMLCAIPFGGFIKMAGDNNEECKGRADEFLARRPGHRAQVIFGGSLFNYILAFFCLWFVYFLGYPRSTTTIGELVNGMPAQTAGLQAGDKVLEVDGQPVLFWNELTKKIYAKKGELLRLKVRRQAQEFEIELTPQMKQVETAWGKKVELGLIGIRQSDEVIKVRYGLGEALVRGARELVQMTVMTVVSIFYIVTGTMSFRDSVTGPLGIFFITSGAAQLGFSAVLQVAGILSMSLAIFNMLPLPILDGGHMVLLGLERLRKRPLPVKVEEVINNIGLSFLIVLAIFIFGNDILRYGYWDRLLAMIGK